MILISILTNDNNCIFKHRQYCVERLWSRTIDYTIDVLRFRLAQYRLSRRPGGSIAVNKTRWQPWSPLKSETLNWRLWIVFCVLRTDYVPLWPMRRVWKSTYMPPGLAGLAVDVYFKFESHYLLHYSYIVWNGTRAPKLDTSSTLLMIIHFINIKYTVFTYTPVSHYEKNSIV